MNYFFSLPSRLWRALKQGDFYRNWLRVLWLFFPSILFVIFTAIAFWNIEQGKDLMVYTLENTKVFIFFLIALIFWAYVVWYSSRLVSKAKYWEMPEHLWLQFRVHLPRMLGFTCFTIIILAFLQLQIPESPEISSGWAFALLLLSFIYYIVINRIWSFLILIKEIPTKKIYWVFTLLFILCFVSLYIFKNFFTVLIILLFLLQMFSVLFFLVRRKHISDRMHKAEETVSTPHYDYGRARGFKLLGKKILRLLRDPEEKKDIQVFNYIAILAFGIYIAVIASVRVSVFIGTFPFALLAFGVLVGFINVLCTLSIFTRFNIHLLIWAYAFMIGSRQEPHQVGLIEKQNTNTRFDNRQKLKEYFTNWLLMRYPNPDSIQSPRPLYFVLSDGGASRSGYWVASVLSRWEDSARQNFSGNLFCLSGASGGSLGNVAFYNLLRNRPAGDSGYLVASKKYLKSDFLTYTLGRMLGPDVFRYVFSFLMPVKDRAYALSKTLEQSAGKNDPIGNGMTSGMSELITQRGKPDSLPVLCINTTRMQDGQPGVISTLDISEYYYNGRIDVLDLVDEEKDLKLSSAVVLGASFPYVSPAGQFKHEYQPGKWEEQYFVDGGYFDNSGAGVVNEMIIAMKQLMQQDSFLKKYNNKLEFFVYHIANNPGGEPVLKKVNPLVNDLAAPVRTMAGAYGSQTSVNDSRLSNYMNSNFGPGHYTTVNLYRLNDPMRFSMSWLISRRLLDSMNTRLETSPAVKEIWERMKK